MLPSTKLFKTINCPFYEADSDSCSRPYCHFNHVKPDNPPEALTTATSQQNNQTINQPVPVYIPTPKHILEARKANGSTATDECMASKRPRLEYVPKAITNSSAPIPTYIPSSVPNTSCDEYDPSNVFRSDDQSSNHIEGDSNGDDISGLLTELSSEQITKCENNTENMTKNSIFSNESTDLKESKEHNSKENQHKSSSSSSRPHSSSSSSHKSSGHSDRKSSSSSSRSSNSTHKSSHQSSHKSKHSDKDKDKEKSRHSSKSSKDSKHKSEHRSKSSSSSSSRHHSSGHHSDKKTHSSNNRSFNKPEDCINNSVTYDSESEDDDVEAQCRMIFEEFDPSMIEKKSDDATNGLSSASAEEDGNDASSKIDDITKKKRVAHENADKQTKPITLFKSKPNHTKNAMQSVFMRQEIVRKEQEVKQEQERKERDKRELLQSLESDKPEPKVLAPKQNLTPLISPAVLAPPRRPSKIFAPVSNMLAIERAKEKVLQLKQQKMAQHQQFIPKTIAQTAPKGTGRVAHSKTTTTTTTSNTNTTNEIAKAAPPVIESDSSKISNNIRSQYYGLMVKHCMTIYDNPEDGFERAQTEEYAVFKKCSTVVIYKSSALLTINKLRKEALDAGNVNTERHKTISHDVILAGKHGQNTSWNVNRKPSTDGSTNLIDNVSSSKAYDLIAELCMTDDQLKENGYPRSGNGPGFAVIHKKQVATPANPDDRYCRRCGKVYKLDEYDENCVDQCNYHPKSPGFRRGFADNSHRCCQQPAGSQGCMYANYHVTDYLDQNNLTGFIKTIACDDEFVPSRKDIFALDCEMCYTTVGLELTRVTVVDINRKIIYDALVKPDNRIIDYNTIYSGISEKTLQNVTRTLRDVQAVLLSMFNSKTILIGHSLESDFKALKLIHDSVVDTSILYPHKMGPPKKRALKTLCIENLKRIIQEDDGGHNSAEDAEVCIDLVKHYLRNRIK